MGFVYCFIINSLLCFLDMVLTFMGLFSQGQLTNIQSLTRMASVTDKTRWILAIICPTVTLKRALFNMRLKSDSECISALNSIMLTNFSYKEPSLSLKEPGVGNYIVFFVVQTVAFGLLLLLVENRHHICKLSIIDCLRSGRYFKRVRPKIEISDIELTSTRSSVWDASVRQTNESDNFYFSSISFSSISMKMSETNDNLF